MRRYMVIINRLRASNCTLVHTVADNANHSVSARSDFAPAQAITDKKGISLTRARDAELVQTVIESRAVDAEARGGSC